MLRHIVLLKFRPNITAAAIDAVLRDVVALREKIDGIIDITLGSNVSPEALEKGFHHGFVVDFIDEAARDAYLPHPEHVVAGGKLVELAEGGIDGILVFDYNC